ncbi:MAG: alpha-L-arabinofuranosidase C-terminal domain-containing protein [Bacteroidota bacterium]
MKRPALFAVIIALFALTVSGCHSEEYDQVTINVSDTGQPIEKYIYGQFIEHLGNCIYGGIWAEMVNDRKFYYPVKEDFDPFGTATDPFWGTGPYQYLKASPWEIIGKGKNVQMERDNPYTGEFAVRIQAPGDGAAAGIRQYGLGLIQGQKYSGRIILSGENSTLPVIVRLSSGDRHIEVPLAEISPEYCSAHFEFESTYSSDSVTLEIFSKGSGHFIIGTLSIMPADHIRGWRKDVVALMKELESPVYRWPGGNFVSGYNWRDGIGDRDKRPPRKNPAWKGVEPNDVGIHEYMELMEILEAEAFIAVNTGLGTLEEVVQEVEYVNGPADSQWGQIRAVNGHPEPYGVKWWAVGNEMFGSWQLGHMPLSEYVNKHNSIADAIWKVDPEAQLIGVGAVGEWSETMLSESADKMNLISEHIYCRELDSVPAHIDQIANSVKRVADAHRKYRSGIKGLAEKNIRIAMDEWNYWYGDYLYGELGVRYHHKDALGIAKGLHAYFRNSDLFFMANYAQTVNVIGCIKTTTTSAGFATTALPLILYRKHFESVPVRVGNAIPGLDIAAAVSPAGGVLTVSMVNSGDLPVVFELDVPGISLPKEAGAWTIHHEDPEAYNVPGQDAEVTIVESVYKMKKQRIEVPSYAILLLKFEI